MTTAPTCVCGKQWSLESETLAENLATILSWRDGRPLYTYWCRQGRAWHVTRKKQSRKGRSDAA